jgi:hypothetical protein
MPSTIHPIKLNDMALLWNKTISRKEKDFDLSPELVYRKLRDIKV